MEDVEAEKFPTKKVRRRKGSETSSSIKLRNFDLDKLSSVPLRGNEDDEQVSSALGSLIFTLFEM
jgi:hypothetical protein